MEHTYGTEEGGQVIFGDVAGREAADIDLIGSCVCPVHSERQGEKINAGNKKDGGRGKGALGVPAF